MSFFERLKTEASAEWRAYTEHPFTNGLADGSLAEAAFRHSADASVLRRSKKLMIFRRVCFAMSIFGSLPIARRKSVDVDLVRLNHPRRDLVRSIGVCPASPPIPWSRAGALF